MNTSSDCDRARIQLMASLDGETDSPAESHQQHFSSCSLCQQWLADLQAMTVQLQGLPYPDRHQRAPWDLWPGVEARIHQLDQRSLTRWLLPFGVLILGWRALQLFIALPVPLLHPLVPLTVAFAALWHIAGDLLAIETSAPELRKRGV